MKVPVTWFLLLCFFSFTVCGVPNRPLRLRWGASPLHDAKRFGDADTGAPRRAIQLASDESAEEVVTAGAPLNETSTLSVSVFCDLSPLEGVRRLVGDLVIDSRCAADALPDLGFVSDLEEVEGSVRIENTLFKTPFSVSFPSLREVRGDGETGEGGDVIARNCSRLESLSFEALETVEAGFEVGAPGGGNPFLREINFGFLKNVGGEFRIQENGGLTALSCRSLVSVGNLTVSGNEQLALFSLSSLVSVGGNVFIGDSSALTTFSLDALSSVRGSVYIRDNSGLSSFGMHALESVGSFLRIRRNSALTTFDLGGLKSVGGFFHVVCELTRSIDRHRNCVLTSFSMDALESVGGDLYIGGNDALTFFSMHGLESVGRHFTVGGTDWRGRNTTNSALTTVRIEQLRSVGGNFTVTNNESLKILALRTCSSPVPPAGEGEEEEEISDSVAGDEEGEATHTDEMDATDSQELPHQPSSSDPSEEVCRPLSVEGSKNVQEIKLDGIVISEPLPLSTADSEAVMRDVEDLEKEVQGENGPALL